MPPRLRCRLLRAVARGRRARIALPYLDGSRLWLDYLP